MNETTVQESSCGEGRERKHETEKRENGKRSENGVKVKVELMRILEAHRKNNNFHDILATFQLIIQCH